MASLRPWRSVPMRPPGRLSWLLTDGLDTGSWLDGETLAQLSDRTDATVYVVLMGPDDTGKTDRAVLTDIARRTGGRTVVDTLTRCRWQGVSAGARRVQQSVRAVLYPATPDPRLARRPGVTRRDQEDDGRGTAGLLAGATVNAAALFTLILGLATADRAAGTLESCLKLYANGDYAGAGRCAAAIEPADLTRQASTAVRETSPKLLRQRLRLLAALDTELRIDGGALMACAIPEPFNGFPAGMARKRKPTWVEHLELAGDGRADRGGTGLDEPDWTFLKQWHLLSNGLQSGARVRRGGEGVYRERSGTRSGRSGDETRGGCALRGAVLQVQRRPGQVADAERSYRAALTAEESRRLLEVRGAPSDALTLLEPLNLVEETRTRYLARMFSALAHERAGALSQAQHFYELAEHDGATASSTIGLASLAYPCGRQSEGSRVVVSEQGRRVRSVAVVRQRYRLECGRVPRQAAGIDPAGRGCLTSRRHPGPRLHFPHTAAHSCANPLSRAESVPRCASPRQIGAGQSIGHPANPLADHKIALAAAAAAGCP